MEQAILQGYISRFGRAPKQPAHLIAFSKQDPNFSTINYGTAKQIINKYNSGQKYKALKKSATTKHKSNKNQKILNKAWKSANSKSSDKSFDYAIQPKPKKTKSKQTAIKPQQIITPSSITNINANIQNRQQPLTHHVIGSGVNHNNSPQSQSLSTSASVETNESLTTAEEEEHKQKNIVLDNGTSFIKVGYVGDTSPKSIFNPCHIGKRILSTNPISRGIIKNLYDIEDIYRFAFNNVLGINDDDLTEYGMIMTCAAFNPRHTAEKLCELIFETFDMSRFFISCSAVLSLYAVQKVSGFVIDVGGSVTQCVPIFEGCPVAQACKRLDIGGKDIDEYLFDLLKHKKLSNIDMNICRQIKEKYGYIALDYKKESAKKFEYKLPDGTTFNLGDERFKCGELLFSYLSNNSIDKQVFESIMACDADIRKELFNNIVISGGSTMIRGIKNRLTKDIINLCKSSRIKKTQKYAKKINVMQHKNRDILSWKGGSVFGSLTAFDDGMWYTKEQFIENGSLLSTRIENNNIFFYDDYSPKEVDLKEIQNYNINYRRRSVSVYTHKNSITYQYDKPEIKTNSVNTSSSVVDSNTNNIKIEPWNDNDQQEVSNNNNDNHNVTVQKLLSQIEDLQLENSKLKRENQTLKKENKIYRENEKKHKNEKLEMQTQQKHIIQQLQKVQQSFNNTNNMLQTINIDLGIGSQTDHNHHSFVHKIEPIND